MRPNAENGKYLAVALEQRGQEGVYSLCFSRLDAGGNSKRKNAERSSNFIFFNVWENSVVNIYGMHLRPAFR